ncbi:hypothetical protein Tco_0278221 [Tanacetum coccineum]
MIGGSFPRLLVKKYIDPSVEASHAILIGKLTSYLLECKLDDEIRASYDDEEAQLERKAHKTLKRDYKPSIQMIELDENHFRILLGVKFVPAILTGKLTSYLMECKLDDKIRASYDDEELHVLSLKEFLICQEEDYVNASQTHSDLAMMVFLWDYKPSIKMMELDENHFRSLLGVKICSSREILTKLTGYLMECKLDDEIRASYDDEEAHVLSLKEFLICQQEDYVNASQTHSDLAMMVFMWLNACFFSLDACRNIRA